MEDLEEVVTAAWALSEAASLATSAEEAAEVVNALSGALAVWRDRQSELASAGEGG
jgi:hypothetical protein